MNNIEEVKIDDRYLSKWQNIVDTLAELMDIEDALITKLSRQEIQILKSYNKNKSEPFYKEGDKVFKKGHYCEKVIEENNRLIISDVEKLEQTFEEAEDGLIAYMGFPIHWPNEEIFGTICVHDKKERLFKQNYRDLMSQYRELIESHLEIIYKKEMLKKEVKNKNQVKKKYRKISNRLNSIYDNIKQGVCLHKVIYDDNKAVDYKILDANQSYTDILDIPKEEAIGSLGSQLYNSDDPPFLDKYVKVAETGKSIQFEQYYSPMNIYFNITVTSPAKGKFITLFSDITERKKREDKIRKQKEKLVKLNNKLNAYNQEVIAINEELEESMRELDHLNKRFTEMINLVSELGDKTLTSEKEFFSNLLARAIDIVPEADYGKICITDEKGNCNFIDAMGHEFEKLKEVDIKTKSLYHYQEKGVFESKGYFINLCEMSQEKKQYLKEALKPVKNSLYINITIDDELAGRIGLDIKKGSDAEFTDTTKRILKSFATLSSTFFAFKKFDNLKTNFTKELITSIIKMVEMYDYYTKGHSENVAELATVIADKMNLSKRKVQETYWAGLVHDIGKLLIPIDILNKSGKLSSKEYYLIKKHPVWGSKVLKNSKSLQTIAHQVRYHHERWDGTGYPNGLKGDEIPIISQIIAVADAWDAMLSERAYRAPLSKKEAFGEIRKNKGKQFSPEVVEVFLSLQKNYDMKKLKDNIMNYTIDNYTNKRVKPSELSFKNFFENSREGIVLLDTDFNIQKTNNYFKEMFEFEEEKIQGEDIKTIVPSEKYNESEQYVDELIKEGEVSSRSYRKKKNGDMIEVSIQAFPISIENEELGYYVVYRDLTELKNIEKEYQNVKDRYKSLFNNKYTVMLIIDPETGDIVDANPAAERFYGWSKNHLTSMKIMDINIMDTEAVKKEMRKANKKQKLYFDFKHRTAKDEIKNVEVYSQPIKFGDKQYLYSIIHDVTNRKKVDRKLKKQRKQFKKLLVNMGNSIS